MNVQTIRMPRRTAQRRLQVYRDALRTAANKEYEAVCKGYAALARGKALLDLNDVFGRCPFDEEGLPKLAIAWADARKISFQWGWNGPTTGRFVSASPSWRALTVEFGRRPSKVLNADAHTTVPLIPPDAQPKAYKLPKSWLLWEVESWHAQPPRDPYLLTHLAGSLYVIEATWDLTELERAVIRAR